MSKHLPVRANLEHLKAQAKDLQRDARRGERKARARVAHVLSDAPCERLKLSQAQHVIARELGFDSWPKLKAAVAQAAAEHDAAPEAPLLFEQPYGEATRMLMPAERSTLEACGSFRPGTLDAGVIARGLSAPLCVLPLRLPAPLPASPLTLSGPHGAASEAVAGLAPGDFVVLFQRLDTDAGTVEEPRLAPIGVVASVFPGPYEELAHGASAQEIFRAARAARGAPAPMPIAPRPVRVLPLCRVRLERVSWRRPLPQARVSQLRGRDGSPEVVERLAEELRDAVRAHERRAPQRRVAMPVDAIAHLRDPGELADFVATRLRPDPELRDKLLEASDVELRLRQVLQMFDGLRLLGASYRFDFR